MQTLNDIRQAARQAIADGRLSYSIELYEKIFEKSKKAPHIDDVINYGAILRKLKQLSKASQHYIDRLEQFPDNINLIRNACNCWIEIKDFERCRSVLEQALDKDKCNTVLLLTLGFTELSAGQTNRAYKIFENILNIDPNNFDALFNIAVAKAKAGFLEEALICFRKADLRKSNNNLLKSNIIAILRDLNRIEEARYEIEKLNSGVRSSGEIKKVETSLLIAEEKYAEASILLKDLTQENPHNPRHWLDWSTCLKAMKFTVAPKKILQTAILWHPKDINLQHSYAQSMAEMGKLESYKQAHNCWQYDISELSSEHIFSRQFLEISSESMSHRTREKLAKHWETQQLSPETRNLWADRIAISKTSRPIRIGYLSADWRNHPVGRFMLPILKFHDRSKFEIWCIDSTPNHDWISKQLKQQSDHWLSIKNLNGLEAARKTSNAQLDILIELGGFTGGSRLDCIVHRPCAIQLSYLGYPAPTYLDCIDGWIGDKELFSTLSQDEYRVHPLEYIDGGYMAFDPGTGIPEPKRDHSDTYRFGCFNHARKLTQSTIDLFCKVLHNCPQSILLLKSISFHEEDEQHRIRTRFEKSGIHPERLIMLDWVNGGLDHLACYNLIDAALDPYPYGGATTTAEALWMGVPVITLRHSGMAGCLSTSILAHGGQNQWIANNLEEYLHIAQTLFNYGARSDRERLKLRYEMQKSPVGDGRRLSQALESLYLNLHQRGAKPS